MESVPSSVYYQLTQAKSPEGILKIVSSHLAVLGFYSHTIILIDREKNLQ